MRRRIVFSILLTGCIAGSDPGLLAECPLDHFIIGCNRDGLWGTADDNDLFVDSTQKYRDSGEEPYSHWFYPLQQSIFTKYPFRIGEPGFDVFQATNPNATYTYDPNRALIGDPDRDFRLVIECIRLSSGLRAVHKDYPQFTIDQVGQSFCHSEIQVVRQDGHMHMSYQADTASALRWITWQIRDEAGVYGPSDPFTIVFNAEPVPGDLIVDGVVDLLDWIRFSGHWLRTDASLENDFHERADANRDGIVNLIDFAMLASHWTGLQEPH